MAKDALIYTVCGTCGGDGVVTAPSPIPPHTVEDTPCPSCEGTGGNLWGWTEKATQ